MTRPMNVVELKEQNKKFEKTIRKDERKKVLDELIAYIDENQNSAVRGTVTSVRAKIEELLTKEKPTIHHIPDSPGFPGGAFVLRNSRQQERERP